MPVILFWVADSALLLIATLSFPAYFALGTHRLSMIAAAVISGLVWTLIVWYSMPLVNKFKITIKGTAGMMLFYWLANFIGLWLTARLAPYTGFGTSKFVWILVLALVANMVQYMIWMLGKFKS